MRLIRAEHEGFWLCMYLQSLPSLYLVKSLASNSCSFSTDISTWCIGKAFPDTFKMSSKNISTSFLWLGTAVIIILLLFFQIVSHSLKTCDETTKTASLNLVCFSHLPCKGRMISLPLILMHFSPLSTGGDCVKLLFSQERCQLVLIECLQDLVPGCTVLFIVSFLYIDSLCWKTHTGNDITKI